MGIRIGRGFKFHDPDLSFASLPNNLFFWRTTVAFSYFNLSNAQLSGLNICSLEAHTLFHIPSVITFNTSNAGV